MFAGGTRSALTPTVLSVCGVNLLGFSFAVSPKAASAVLWYVIRATFRVDVQMEQLFACRYNGERFGVFFFLRIPCRLELCRWELSGPIFCVSTLI